jgi:fructan beta-fructosidase
MRSFILSLFLGFSGGIFNFSLCQTFYHEAGRPKIHFSPKEKWMNDPNGMVYNKGIYHLFFQYNPDSVVPGAIHWGHAISHDLVHWQEQPIAIYPDSLGFIFSGSAVVDKDNTSGFGSKSNPPLVAIFTQHDPVGERQGKDNYQTQSIAYSLDNGKSWKKYKDNPVLRNPGITDFRDPKIFWYQPGKKWVMALATKDRISFYSSKDLKKWAKESEFGKDRGAHGGVWECPDLISFVHQGKMLWALIVNLNPGGPNGGSATQYFIGHFDGKNFTSQQKITKWLDYGPDEYAGVTWSNIKQGQVIFLGWMSNWLYASRVPTEGWRNAMTVPRLLEIKKVKGELYISSQPHPALSILNNSTFLIPKMRSSDLSVKSHDTETVARSIRFNAPSGKTFSIIMENLSGNKLVIGYDQLKKEFFIDRRHSGKDDFEKSFAGYYTSPRISPDSTIDIHLIIDVASVEIFADHGLTVMSSTFFPEQPYSTIRMESPEDFPITSVELRTMKSIWGPPVKKKNIKP